MKFLVAVCITAAMLVSGAAVAGAATTSGTLGGLPGPVAKVHKVPKVADSSALRRLKQALLHARFGDVNRLSAHQRAVLKVLRRNTKAHAPGRTSSKAQAADVLIGYVGADWYNVNGTHLYQGMDWYEYSSSSIGTYYESFEWSWSPAAFLWDHVAYYYVPAVRTFYGPFYY